MTRNQELAAILRAAADGAEPAMIPTRGQLQDGQVIDYNIPASSTEAETGRMTARILRAMATVYETAAKAEEIKP
jgi:hypothetical protein